MRITEKGQVTIPQAIREQAGMMPGTEVAFDLIAADLAINPMIYAEISVVFPTEAALESLLEPAGLRRLDLPCQAAFVAGKAFLDYRKRGGVRTSPLPDFYMGAHAAIAGFALLTRDLSRYRTYFPRLELLTP